MSRRWQKYVAVFGIAFFAIFVQCAAVCQAVKCDVPKHQSSCPKHQHQQPEPQKLCKDVAAVVADIHLDLTPALTAQILDAPVFDAQFIVASLPEARDHAPPESFTILRI